MRAGRFATTLLVAALGAGCAVPSELGIVPVDLPDDRPEAGLDVIPHFAWVSASAEEEPVQVMVKVVPGRRVSALDASPNVVDIPGLGVKIVTLPKGANAYAALAALNQDSGVVYAEPDRKAVAAADFLVNDPYFGYQWGLKTIQAPTAWGTAKSLATVKIAILDTGIDANHADLKGKVVAARNFSSAKTTNDLFGHGTHCAGIAAAMTNNKIGVAGTGFNAALMNVKVLDDNGGGSYSSITNGLVWAVNNGAKVVSMSLGGSAASKAMEDSLTYAVSKGVIVVAAAGNANSSAPSYPAYYDQCIAVAATTVKDVRASYSNYGAWVDVAAPGDAIYSTLPSAGSKVGPRNYGTLSGTSMATPFVAGEAALLVAMTSTSSVRARIEGSCDPIVGTGTQWKFGRINLAKAVALP